MKTSRPSITRITTIFVVALVALAAALAPGGRAHAQIDLSGMWDISFGGIISGSCSAAIYQTDSDLEILADCAIGYGTLNGSIDSSTGSFEASGSLSGLNVTIEGTAADDGSSIEGEWSGMGFAGSFAGTRTSTEMTLIDLTGDWDIVLFGDGSELCSARFEQALMDLAVTLSCEGLGDGTLEGTAHPLTSYFEVGGAVGSNELWLGGYLGQDGGMIQGFWNDISRIGFGDFLGTPADGLDAGLMMLGCGGSESLHQTSCTSFIDVDGGWPTFHVQIHVVLPPQDGYFGFQAGLHWAGDIISYVPPQDPQDEVLWEENCDTVWAAVILPVPPLISGCVPFPALSEGSTATGPILQFEFQCKEEGGTPLELVPGQGGTHFLGAEGNAIHPLLLDMPVNCLGLPGIGGGGPDDQAPGEPAASPTAAPANPTASGIVPTATPSGEVLSANNGVMLPSTGAGQPHRGAALLPLALLALGGALLLGAGSLGGARRGR